MHIININDWYLKIYLVLAHNCFQYVIMIWTSDKYWTSLHIFFAYFLLEKMFGIYAIYFTKVLPIHGFTSVSVGKIKIWWCFPCPQYELFFVFFIFRTIKIDEFYCVCEYHFQINFLIFESLLPFSSLTILILISFALLLAPPLPFLVPFYLPLPYFLPPPIPLVLPYPVSITLLS